MSLNPVQEDSALPGMRSHKQVNVEIFHTGPINSAQFTRKTNNLGHIQISNLHTVSFSDWLGIKLGAQKPDI